MIYEIYTGEYAPAWKEEKETVEASEFFDRFIHRFDDWENCNKVVSFCINGYEVGFVNNA